MCHRLLSASEHRFMMYSLPIFCCCGSVVEFDVYREFDWIYNEILGLVECLLHSLAEYMPAFKNVKSFHVRLLMHRNQHMHMKFCQIFMTLNQ